MEKLSYTRVPSRFGPLAILWQETAAGPRVQRVLLPNARVSLEVRVRQHAAAAGPRSSPAIADLVARMASFLEGAAIAFELDLVALEACSAFQQRVLRAEHAIPRGWVSTYGRIARHLGVPGAARAVGGALAHNPFPILIPCHRAIAADGTLGGFQGGPALKRALLEMEGIEISPAGKVRTERVYYG